MSSKKIFEIKGKENYSATTRKNEFACTAQKTNIDILFYVYRNFRRAENLGSQVTEQEVSNSKDRINKVQIIFRENYNPSIYGSLRSLDMTHGTVEIILRNLRSLPVQVY